MHLKWVLRPFNCIAAGKKVFRWEGMTIACRQEEGGWVNTTFTSTVQHSLDSVFTSRLVGNKFEIITDMVKNIYFFIFVLLFLCWHALMFKKHIIFQILYIIVGPLCPASLKCIVFYKVPPPNKCSLLWLANRHSALWLAEHHKHSSEM